MVFIILIKIQKILVSYVHNNIFKERTINPSVATERPAIRYYSEPKKNHKSQQNRTTALSTKNYGTWFAITLLSGLFFLVFPSIS